MAKDMTQGSLLKALIQFSFPLLLSGLLQQLYSWSDAFMVGNIEGELSLAAIGSTIPISDLIIMMITGFSLGICVLSGQLYGSGEHSELKKVLSTFTIVLSGIFLLAVVAGILFMRPLLRLLQTPYAILENANSYLLIILLGIPFLVIYNVYSAVLRGMGDSKASFWAIVISSVINVLTDILFVVVLRYGVIGAAVSTVIAQVLMAVFIVCYSIKKYDLMKFRIDKHCIDGKILRRGFSLSLPTAIQSSVHSVGNLTLQNFMNGFGAQTVAAITASYRVDGIIMLPIINFGYGISTVVAQNTGAGNHQRAKRGVFVGMGVMAVVAVILTIAVIPNGGTLVSIFGVTEKSAAIGKTFFSIIAPFYLVYGIATAIRSFLEGVGDVVYTGIISIATLGVRILLTYTLSAQYGNSIIALAEGLSWAVLLLLCVVRFVWKYRKSASITFL
jgi:putative MATE family efflux protein